MNPTAKLFASIGGNFISSPESIVERLSKIKAFVFDWDGVMNNALKFDNKSSLFNEADSMGTNLLRYNYYYHFGLLPYTGIISGERNEMAFYFSQREHFSSMYHRIPNKIVALEHFMKKYKIQANEICYFFDDVLDLSIANVCGLRILINRKASQLFQSYVIKNNLADYITANESGDFAVREACEMLIGLTGTFDNIISDRVEYNENYQDYIRSRNAVITGIYTQKDGVIFSNE